VLWWYCAGAVTEMEVLLLHSAWFRLGAGWKRFLLQSLVGWKNLGVVVLQVVESLYLLVDLAKKEV